MMVPRGDYKRNVQMVFINLAHRARVQFIKKTKL